ncbi:SHOCT domain-containing protein [Arthrobacter ginkgonis]|uniref:SHOCT domain-containing protein n=1 Tax=Arthrobacter ginkgonis TaxID=1630594 RepID=A0ABP7CDX9_9MICC
MSIWEDFWDIVWWFIWVFAFVAYLYALFAIISDLFRDHTLNGWLKALWLIFLVFVPFLTALIYLIARGRGMAERSAKEMKAYQASTEAYIRDVAGASPSEEIGKAKALLDSGAITAEDFEKIKNKALAA